MTRSAFRAAVEDILDIPPGTLKDSDGRDSISSWTSIADVQILAVINSELGIEAEPALLEAESFGEVMNWLGSRNAFRT